MNAAAANGAGLAKQASVMTRLDACPSCSGANVSHAFEDNDLTALTHLPDDLKHSDFMLCRTCGLIYAAWRQVPDAASAYYDLFAGLEHRSYAVYPPPEDYRDAKRAVARWLLGELETAGALSNGQTLLHIRCDCGSLGPVLREKYPDSTVIGQDYFETNVRYANETGNLTASLLKPAGLAASEHGPFDVIIVNHIFTHAIDPHADLAVCRSMLKPGGTLFFCNENDFYETLRLRGRYYRLKPVNNYHKQLFTPGSLKRYFNAGGFEVTKAARRKNTITGFLKPSPDIRFDAAPEAEIDDLSARLKDWNNTRSSLKGTIVGFGPIKQVLKKLAPDLPPLPY